MEKHFKNPLQYVELFVFVANFSRKLSYNTKYLGFFTHFLYLKIRKLLKMKLKLVCVPVEFLKDIISKQAGISDEYFDSNLYVVCHSKYAEKKRMWYTLCSRCSNIHYKVVAIFTEDIPTDCLYVSETMKFNVQKYNICAENSECYFLISVPESLQTLPLISDLNISMIKSPCEYDENLVHKVLQKYFTTPKYLRTNSVFDVDINYYFNEFKYSGFTSKCKTLYFKVNKIVTGSHNSEGFAIYQHTTLIQANNTNFNFPPKCGCDLSIFKPLDYIKYKNNFYPFYNESVDMLLANIYPFTQKDFKMKIKPLFLMEGTNCMGKTKIIKIAADILGYHSIESDFVEIQSLTAAHGEAKLRIILNSAESCVPCILIMKNIQIFGINTEGQTDERILNSFENEVEKLFNKKLEYPLIIIATSNESSIPINKDSTFIDTIKLGPFSLEKRLQIMAWLINTKNFDTTADFNKILKVCPNFTVADINAICSHTLKNKTKFKEKKLTTQDFIQAVDYMQSIFSDQFGAPKIPKISWNDIGGLADLKKEIIKRIEVPLLNKKHFNRSGILLYGPPGTGKTLLAKAIATEFQLHFLSVKGPELLNMYVGQSEKNIRQVFEKARASSPCIIFFDELDSLAPHRGFSGDSGGVMDRIVSQLLAEIDGLGGSNNIFIIGATNRPDLLDPALLRPGRFDKMLYVGIYSDFESKFSVLNALTHKFHMSSRKKELINITKMLPTNLTGADLYSLCSNAWLQAVKRILAKTKKEIGSITSKNIIVINEDFKIACKNLVPSITEEDLKHYEKLKRELS